MEHSQVLIRPVVSEKSYVLAAANRYTFRVHEIDVRTMSVKSKPKRRGTTRGRTRGWRKAIVQVRPGETIPVFQGLQGLES
jgi:large subunit ribosomal protein L23